jgi:hypothetical protein
MIRLRTLIKRQGRSLLIGGALALVCLGVAWAHSAPAAHEMNGSGDDQMAEAISICLAVLQIAGGLLAAISGALIVRRRRPPRSLSATFRGSLFVSPGPVPPVAARAGPAALQVFRR